MMELVKLSHEVRYRGKVFDLEIDRIQYPSGNEGIREVARHPGAVAVPSSRTGVCFSCGSSGIPCRNTPSSFLPAN